MTYTTKTEAITAAREARKNGFTAKVFRKSFPYTQPGRGITVHIEYFVEINN